jgi:hypothetical protein
MLEQADIFAGKAMGVSRARWPVKSAEILLGLLKNAEANAGQPGPQAAQAHLPCPRSCTYSHPCTHGSL